MRCHKTRKGVGKFLGKEQKYDIIFMIKSYSISELHGDIAMKNNGS